MAAHLTYFPPAEISEFYHCHYPYQLRITQVILRAFFLYIGRPLQSKNPRQVNFLVNFSIGPPTYGHFPPSRAKPTLPCPIQIPTSSLARSPSNHHTNKHLDSSWPHLPPSTLIQSSSQEIRKIDCCRNLAIRRPIAVRTPLSSPADSTLALRLMRAVEQERAIRSPDSQRPSPTVARSCQACCQPVTRLNRTILPMFHPLLVKPFLKAKPRIRRYPLCRTSPILTPPPTRRTMQ